MRSGYLETQMTRNWGLYNCYLLAIHDTVASEIKYLRSQHGVLRHKFFLCRMAYLRRHKNDKTQENKKALCKDKEK